MGKSEIRETIEWALERSRMHSYLLLDILADIGSSDGARPDAKEKLDKWLMEANQEMREQQDPKADWGDMDRKDSA